MGGEDVIPLTFALSFDDNRVGGVGNGPVDVEGSTRLYLKDATSAYCRRKGHRERGASQAAVANSGVETGRNGRSGVRTDGKVESDLGEEKGVSGRREREGARGEGELLFLTLCRRGRRSKCARSRRWWW